ncbi:MAG TPA: hypothetical protein VK737_03755, partial [Opitutales bacterium]|nr:hypothetical protein [Opitutales bacterium]
MKPIVARIFTPIPFTISLRSYPPMKTHRKTYSPTPIALALAAGLLAGAIIPSSPLLAQAATPASASANQKIQLFSDAITAQQNGDLAKAGGDVAKANSDYAQAKDLFGQIVALDPTDPGNKDIQVRMAQLDQMMAQQSKGMPSTGGAIVAASSAADTSSTTAAAPTSGKSAANQASVEATSELAIQAEKQKNQMATVRQDRADAMASDKAGNYDDARAKLAKADAELPPGIASNSIHAGISQDVAKTWYDQTLAAINAADFAAAQTDIKSYQDNGGDANGASALSAELAKAQHDPRRQPVDPAFQAKQDTIAQLLVQGEAEYFYGDYNDAQSVFNQVIIYDPNNVAAQAYQKKINELLFDSSSLPHDSVRIEMLKEVNDDWRMPGVYVGQQGPDTNKPVVAPDIKKLGEIIIPRVDIDVPTPLDDVITTLTVLSRQYDKDNKGLNFHVEPPSNGQSMPKIKLRELNDVSLQKLLDMACQDAGYGYYDDDGIIQVAQGASGGASTSLSRSYQTKPFPMTDATLTRLLGIPPSGDSSNSTADSSFSASGGGSSSGSSDSAPASGDIESRLQSFFERSGIDFPAGSRVSYASPNIYVTNTPKNLQALDSFLKQFSTVKQAEIEARFLDVNQGDLQEMGFNWNVSNPTPGQENNFLQTTNLNGSTTIRNLGTAFPLGNSGANPTIVAGLSTSSVEQLPETIDPTTGAINGGGNITVTTPLPNLTIPQSIPTLPNEV